MSAAAGGFAERRLGAQDGLSLYYRDYPCAEAGARPPVLCLSGVARNSKDFDGLARHLARRRRVVALDCRGRGRSQRDPRPANYQPTTYLRDIAHLLAAARLPRVVVIGTSLGGLLGLALAVTAPTVLAGVVLNDSGPDPDPAYLARLLPYIGRDEPLPDLATAVAGLQARFPEIGFRDPETWQRFARGTYREGDDGLLHVDWDPAIAGPLQRGLAALPDLWPIFGAVRNIPALAIRGSRSPVLSAETFARMAREKPDLRQLTVDGLGHAPSLEEHEAREAIDDFLERFDG